MHISQFKLLVIPPGTLQFTQSNHRPPLNLWLNLRWDCWESLR
uniref:Uncharacterized protein n=1 Tax=Klebsiella phage PMBT70 TaxID=3229741 RepID=A0AB39C4X2_9CAUD